MKGHVIGKVVNTRIEVVGEKYKKAYMNLNHCD